MPFVERLLAPDERVVFRTGLHPGVLLGGAGSFALFVTVVATLIIINNDKPLAFALKVMAWAIVAMAAGAVLPLCRLLRTELAVTSRRLLVRSGALRSRLLAVPLDRPNVVDLQHGWAGERVPWATVIAVTPQGEVHAFGHVAQAAELVRAARAQARGASGGRRS
ncbi:MAG: PH domain-containing protein [bacterium]|nr:PH domain-containing protein [bacterium]